MEDLARLSLDTDSEFEDSLDTAPRPRSVTPSRPSAPARLRRGLLVRSSSAGPWTTQTVIQGSLRHDPRRPGRSLTRESSQTKRRSPSSSSGMRQSNGHGRTIIIFIIIIPIALLCSMFLIPIKETSCEENRNAKLPLTELHKQLKKNLVGQNLAVESLLQNLKTFTASSGDRPLVLWLSGWEGSGKTLTINILKSVLPKQYKVQTVLAPLLHGSPDNLQQKAMSLVQGLDPCSPNFLVIDGWDGESRLPLAILDHFLKTLHHPDTSPQNTSRVLIVLSGTRGGKEVWQYFLDLQQREGIFERNFLDHDFTDLSIRLQNAHFLTSVTKNVALIPFLPMDDALIKSCVMRELLRMQREDVVIDEAARTRVMKEVFAHTEFVPNSHPLLAIHGCKRVPALLALVLSESMDDLRL